MLHNSHLFENFGEAIYNPIYLKTYNYLKRWEMLHIIPFTWKAVRDSTYNSIYLKTCEMLHIIPFIRKHERCYIEKTWESATYIPYATYNSIYLKTSEILHIIPFIWKMRNATLHVIPFVWKTWELMIHIFPFTWKDERCYI